MDERYTQTAIEQPEYRPSIIETGTQYMHFEAAIVGFDATTTPNVWRYRFAEVAYAMSNSDNDEPPNVMEVNGGISSDAYEDLLVYAWNRAEIGNDNADFESGVQPLPAFPDDWYVWPINGITGVDLTQAPPQTATWSVSQAPLVEMTVVYPYDLPSGLEWVRPLYLFTMPNV